MPRLSRAGGGAHLGPDTPRCNPRGGLSYRPGPAPGSLGARDRGEGTLPPDRRFESKGARLLGRPGRGLRGRPRSATPVGCASHRLALASLQACPSSSGRSGPALQPRVRPGCEPSGGEASGGSTNPSAPRFPQEPRGGSQEPGPRAPQSLRPRAREEEGRPGAQAAFGTGMRHLRLVLWWELPGAPRPRGPSPSPEPLAGSWSRERASGGACGAGLGGRRRGRHWDGTCRATSFS